MRFTASLLAGFVSISVATPGSPVYRPDPDAVSNDSRPSETTPIDGDWHIGCDENNYCSYYQGKDLTPDSTVKKLARGIAVSESTCQQCDSKHPCQYCDSMKFHCRDCDHYECHDAFLNEFKCIEFQPEISDLIRNYTEASTVVETSIETLTETSSVSAFVLETTTTTSVIVETTTSTTTQTGIEMTTWTVYDEPVPTPPSSTMTEEPSSIMTEEPSSLMTEEPSLRIPAFHQEFTSTITVTLDDPFMAVEPSLRISDWFDPFDWPSSAMARIPTGTRILTVRAHDATPSVHNLNRRDQGTPVGANTPSPIRRQAAFAPDQCTACDEFSCPECYSDCAECEHYDCVDIATHLSVCMSLRAKWQPPGFNVSASSSMETTTVFIPSMPTPVPMPQVYTSTVVVYPSVPPMETSTVVVYPPGPSTTTTTVVVYPLSPSMTTTTVVAYPSAPSVTTETVVVVPESPSVVEVVTTTVVMGPAPVATTVYVAVPTHSPVVVEIPVNIESTLTRTVLNAARATQEPAPLSRRQDLFEESACVFCEDKEFCDDCPFTCPDCDHLLCEDPFIGEGICVQINKGINANNAHKAFKSSNSFLGQSAKLIFSLNGDIDASITAFNSTQASDKHPYALPMLSFDSSDDCSICSPGDEAYNMCEFQFSCGFQGECSVAIDETIVSLCYEVGEKCPA